MGRKRRIENNNPNATFKEVVEKLSSEGVSLDFLDVTLNRRDPVAGTIKFLTTWRAVPYDRVENLPAMIKGEFGGGEYEVRIQDPNKKIPEPIEWPIMIEGESKVPTPPAPKPVQPLAPPPILPYGMQGMQGMMPPQGGGIPSVPSGMYYDTVSGKYKSVFGDAAGPQGLQWNSPVPFWPPQFSGPQFGASSEKDSLYYREKYEELRKDLDRIKEENNEKARAYERQIHEEKQAREREASQKQHELDMAKMREESRKEMGELKAMIAVNAQPKDDTQARIFQMMNDSNKENARSMMEILKHDVDSTKVQFEMMQAQNTANAKITADYVEQIIKLNDPSKNAELFNILGAQATNTFSLIAQMADSGLLGGKDESPWVDMARQFVMGAKDFGEKILEQNQQKNRQSSRMLQGPRMQGFSGPGPALPPGQQRQVKQQPQRPTSPVDERQRNIDELLKNPIIKEAAPKIFSMISNKASADDVAEEIYDHVSYMGRLGKLPSILTVYPDDPRTALMNLLEIVPVKVDDEYANQIIISTERMIAQMKAEDEAEKKKMKDDGNGGEPVQEVAIPPQEQKAPEVAPEPVIEVQEPQPETPEMKEGE